MLEARNINNFPHFPFQILPDLTGQQLEQPSGTEPGIKTDSGGNRGHLTTFAFFSLSFYYSVSEIN